MLLASSSLDPLLLTGVVLLVLFGGLAWLQRGLGGGPRGRAETVALTRDHAVHVVELGGRRLLVGTGPTGAPRVLAELPELDGLADHEGTELVEAGGWRGLLERFGGRGG